MQSVIKRNENWRVGGVVASMLLCLASLAPSLLAQVSSYGEKQVGPRNDKPPDILNGVAVNGPVQP